MLKKVLIANRGEIALRILRTCKELGIKTVAIYSTVDKKSKNVLLADEAICIGPSSLSKSYLNIPSIISAADITGAIAIHPGYGFLSENVDFAEQVEKSGFIFIGPNIESIKLMSNKISAIKIMKNNGIKCIPNQILCLKNNINKNILIANKFGYPFIIKLNKSSGGLGKHLVNNSKEFISIINLINFEKKILTFNENEIYIEKYLNNARHVEIPIVSDGQGNIICLSDRDCSIQDNYQKLIEEAPAFNINKEKFNFIKQQCIKICLQLNYKGVGTFEFLYKNNQFFFIEMNVRIQVEHTVTEMITGIDLIKLQLLIASGKKLHLKQKNIKIFGHAIECRIKVENLINLSFNSNKIKYFHPPGGLGVRWDSHIYTGYVIPTQYDSMIGKLICFGENRQTAIARMRNALLELIIKGIKTNIKTQLKIITNNNFKKENININFFKNFIKKII